MQHYHVVFQKETGYVKTQYGDLVVPHERPLFINPHLDHVWVDFAHLFDPNNRFATIYDQAPECFDAIKFLELRNFRWQGWTDPLICQTLKEWFWDCGGGILNNFKNLDELHIIEEVGSDAGDLVAMIDDVRNTLEYDVLLGWYDSTDNVNTCPEINFHNWRRLEARTDDDYYEEAIIVD
ncbi:hypothetical protein EG329_000904 [Mollisiaceae sp. DMI_Dod_QoI]|nr:hypothetical protein EG329_000904 [Helotiales sp. DMI_Dod_QoI]